MSTIETFSGTHPYDETHVANAIYLDWFGQPGFTDEQLRVLSDMHATRVTEAVKDGKCPRCKGPLLTGDYVHEHPAGSRITACRCVPVCSACGSDEAVQPVVTGRRISQAWQWPTSKSAMTKRRRKFDAMTAATTVMVTGNVMLDESGVTTIDVTPRSGGWAQYGHDKEVGL